MGERPTSYTKCLQISLRLAPEERLHRLKRQLHFGNFQNGITSTIWFSYRNFRFPSLYGIKPMDYKLSVCNLGRWYTNKNEYYV